MIVETATMITTTIETAQSVLEDKNAAADARKTAENLKKEIEACLSLLDSEKSLQNLMFYFLFV